MMIPFTSRISTRSAGRFSLALLLLAGLALLLGATGPALGQTPDESWSAPLNLSRSAAATEPLLAADAQGVVHALWREEAINSFVYTRGRDGSWQRPFAVELPFGTPRLSEGATGGRAALYTPQLLADANGRLHAFWRDSEGALLYSQVSAGQVASYESWTVPQALAEAVSAWAAAFDGAGRLHLAYARAEDAPGAPAGIYYQRAAGGDLAWSNARNLFDSAYFRGLPAGQAHVSIAATTGGGVWVGWDLRPLEQVFVIGSPNGGQSWNAPIQVDRRQAEDSLSAVGPSQMQVAASGAGVHLLWQAGHGGATCNLLHQWSADAGANWTTAAALSGSQGCPERAQWLAPAADDGSLLLATWGAGGLALTAWDGSRWSMTQGQTSALVSFTDEETFRTVTLGCRQLALARDGLLAAAGCDAGPNGEDVWLLQRPLGDLSAWFGPPPAWSAPAALAALNADVLTFTVAADGAGRVHALWTQAGAPALQYARWESARWSAPAALLRAPDGAAQQPALAAGGSSRLLATWRDSGSGLLYFSQADTARAGSAAEWSQPRALPLPRPGAGGSAVVDTRAGRLLAAYALPINEGRGIYVTASSDGGESWDAPTQAVDAAAQGWALVDNPRLALTGYDGVHLLFTRGDLASGASAQQLFYARSDDGGASWSAPELVQSGAGQAGPVVWSALAGIGERTAHRAWQTRENDRTTLWHQVSLDAGLSWSRAATVGGALAGGASGGAAALAVDENGRVLLLQASGTTLQSWAWDGERWQAGETLSLAATGAPTLLAAGLTADGPVTAVWAAPGSAAPGSAAPGSAENGPGLFFAQGSAATLTEPPAPLPTLTPTPPATPAPTMTPAPQPTPTLVFSREREGGALSQLGVPGVGSTPFQIALGVLPALLIVAVSFYAGVRLLRKR